MSNAPSDHSRRLIPAGLVNPIQTEKRIERLEMAVAVLGVTTVGLSAALLASRFGVLRARVVEAEHVQLTHRATSLSETLGFSRRFPAGELTVRRGRPELRLLDGHVSLMDVHRRVRVQLDPSFRPAAPMRQPTREAVTGQRRMRLFAGRPLLVLSDEHETPMAVLDAARGVQPAPGRRTAGPRQTGGEGAGVPTGGEEEPPAPAASGVADWAQALLAADGPAAAAAAPSRESSGGGGSGSGSTVGGPGADSDPFPAGGFGMQSGSEAAAAAGSGTLIVDETATPSWAKPRRPEDDSPHKPKSVQAEIDADTPPTPRA
ncbi:hypothetical protein FNF28_03677 [Cafeteria roenbergensis]|uniref:Uncharacterized protein n=1 Tax=Cafeteria roenbergensis TaxID=33653 RepID=A0A5A8DLD5_CAFRO|nr:hypothetical protein FNF28_03677 [Cafeteria roenbergensis]